MDAVFLSSLETIGRSIGDFIEHASIEHRARRLAAITESSHDAILSYDNDGRITEWLTGAERLFGHTTQEMVGASIDLIVPEDRREELWSINARIRRGEVVEPYETTRVRKDGTLIEVSVRSSPLEDHSGNVIGITSTDRDVTRQKETERKLVEADRQKDEFIAMLGHELRNPLAAIRTAAELLKLSGGDDPRLTRTQTIIERQAAHMAKLLDGLLDVSRIIRGKIKLEREVVDFAAACRDVASDLAERIGDHQPQVRIDVPDERILVMADRVRLAQIVDNLLTNAVKYTGNGGSVTLSVNRHGDTASLAVRDTGIGIEPELMPYIFDVFRQSKQSLDRSHGGLGLGLALVRSLAELHGGSVEARSEGKNRGSEFIVRLPVAETTGSEAGTPTNEEKPPLNLVVIEDNEDAAEMLQQLLQLAGHRVSVANDGPHGISMVKDCKPDVVLCDLGLPDGVSGFDVAEALRKDPEMRRVRMIALSGYGRPEDKERGKEAGFDAHITKPVDLDTLQRVLSRITTSDAAQ